MGARQSHLNIFLKTKDGTYSGEGYEVTVSQDVASESPNYDVVTHKIEYKNGKPTSFDIYIYNTYKTEHNASYIFAYCSPKDHHVAYQVKAYYSIIVPQAPLVISFVYKNGITYHCNVKKLVDDGWNWAYRISEYLVSLPKHLNDAFEKVLWNKTIGFVSDKTTKDVLVFPRKIDKKNYRLIFIPYKEDAFLNSNCLFNFDTELIRGTEHLVVQRGCKQSSKINQIDPYFLGSVYTKFYHGVLVYFAKEDEKPVTLKEEHYKNTALLIEFISSSDKIHIQRKDKNGTFWLEEKLNYTSYSTLGKTLSDLKVTLNSKDLNTFILDKKESYIGVLKVEPDLKSSFNKYTHSFDNSKDCVFVFNRSTPDFGPLKSSVTKAKSSEVYYLKVTVKGEKVDSKPFLIIVDVDGDEKNKKAYHFDNQDDFKKWVQFVSTDKSGVQLKDDELIKKLYIKVGDIDKKGSCTGELHLLRQLAHRILTKDDVDDISKPTDGPEEKRPPVEPEPQPPPVGPNWLLIIGSSVGAFVFVCLLALAYGIYWYNTTIKLLT